MVNNFCRRHDWMIPRGQAIHARLSNAAGRKFGFRRRGRFMGRLLAEVRPVLTVLLLNILFQCSHCVDYTTPNMTNGTEFVSLNLTSISGNRLPGARAPQSDCRTCPEGIFSQIDADAVKNFLISSSVRSLVDLNTIINCYGCRGTDLDDLLPISIDYNRSSVICAAFTNGDNGTLWSWTPKGPQPNCPCSVYCTVQRDIRAPIGGSKLGAISLVSMCVIVTLFSYQAGRICSKTVEPDHDD